MMLSVSIAADMPGTNEQRSAQTNGNCGNSCVLPKGKHICRG